jgi:hypothetical protein
MQVEQSFNQHGGCSRITEASPSRVRLLERLIRHLQHPPPWRWLCHGRLWQRVGPAPLRKLPLELLQQLHWWLVIPLRRGRRRNRLNTALPFGLRLRACWLNSYQPRELAGWWAAGVRSWKELSCHTPESLVGPLHRERRQQWPAQCRPAIELLGNKAALLALTPTSWRPAFLTLETHTPEDATPNWWWDSLHRNGVVLKPLKGHAGRGVVRFHRQEQGLSQEGLLRQLPQTAPTYPAKQPVDPEVLYRHWQKITGSCEAALASPYLSHSPLLPEANPSVVVRVITAQAAPSMAIGVLHAWLEVPLSSGGVIFLGTDGLVLPKPGEPLTFQQTQELQQWQELLASGNGKEIQACLDAAITMHALLPPIDRVAWDWIPAEPEPLLLEGNGGFGLLVPQLFKHLQQSINATAPDADRPQS